MQSKLVVQCLSKVTGLVKLAAVEWYNGSGGPPQPNAPVLAVVFDNGRAQLMRHELDDSKTTVGKGRTLFFECILFIFRPDLVADAYGSDVCTVEPEWIPAGFWRHAEGPGCQGALLHPVLLGFWPSQYDSMFFIMLPDGFFCRFCIHCVFLVVTSVQCPGRVQV